MALNMQLLQQSGSLVIVDGDVTMYVPIRRSVLESVGFNAETHMFSIGEFTALRDADGEYNGKEWSITAGETKTFAY